MDHQYEDYLPLIDKIIDMEEGEIAERSVSAKKVPPRKRSANLSTQSVIALQHVRFGYDRQTDVLNDIDIKINKGEVVAFCGDNGSGKTTLLKMLSGILRPVQGEIRILDMNKPELESLVGRVGFLFQNPDEQLFAATVEEEVAFGPRCLRRKTDTEKYLKIAGLQAKRLNHPQTLSRGQRQILAVVSVMAMEPEIIILDEPTTGLDDATWHSLITLLYDYADRGGTVVFSTHNEKAAALSDRRITINRGRIVSDEISR